MQGCRPRSRCCPARPKSWATAYRRQKTQALNGAALLPPDVHPTAGHDDDQIFVAQHPHRLADGHGCEAELVVKVPLTGKPGSDLARLDAGLEDVPELHVCRPGVILADH